jgi:tRNA nucleotidyltransferase (CCA-adding enzyme)
MDLYRRDFTINTLAIRLNTRDFGLLVDYFGAQRDLKAKTIRVLHNLSFVEDPTRVFRAVRLEQRLGFHIAAHTENLIKNAVKMNFLEKLGGKRLLSELIHILNENEPIKAVERMAMLGLLRFIHPELVLGHAERNLLLESGKIISWYDLLYLEQSYERWVVYYLALCSALSDDQFVATCTRLAISERYRQQLHLNRINALKVLQHIESRCKDAAPVHNDEIYHLLKPLPIELLFHLMALTNHDQIKKLISLFVTKLRYMQCTIKGEDIVRLGAPQGPLIGKILGLVLNARLNGEVGTADEELLLARKLLLSLK